MASIFNQKEEVLSIELTKHGKMSLANGYFQPKYYSFFDDSIIYDSSYFGNPQEDTNSIQDRILEKSITLKCLNITDNNTKEFAYDDLLGEPLGDSNPFNDYAPAWKLNTLNKKINYVNNISSSYYKKIFNVDILTYQIEKKQNTTKEYKINNKDFVLIDLEELNVSNDIKNFEIELIMEEKTGIQKKLLFHKVKNNIIDDFIYDETELPSSYFDYKITTDDASYYFDVLADEEIDMQTIISQISIPDQSKVLPGQAPAITYDGDTGKPC